jgi:acetylornithine and succinylornithine aminotransferases
MNNYKAIDSENIANTYARADELLVSGKGVLCIDSNGRELIDFSSGIGVNSLGFCDDEWVKAVAGQAAALQHVSNLFYSEPQIKLAKALTDRTGMSKVFFANSGAEANECAIKTARKYGNAGSDGKRNEIVTLKNSFHGRTVATITATGQDEFHQYFYPFAEGFRYCEAGSIDELDSVVGENTCALMLEMIQGEGGVIVMDKDYVKAAAELCCQKDVLLIVDEVQTGIGRTGTFFAYEQYDIEPDMVTFAKGIGGGLPIGGVLFNEKTMDILQPGDHGTTFGGNPVVCAGALAVMNKLTPEFLCEVAAKGEYLAARLKNIPGIIDVDGLGLMMGFRVENKTPSEVVAECLAAGLMTLTAHGKVRLLPPLVIGYDMIDKGLEIIAAVVD